MTTDRDTTRRVRSWLQTDQHESADRVLHAVLDAVDTTPQRRASRWPAWRFPGMVTASKFGLASALVAVAALVGLNAVARNVPLPALGGPPATTAPGEANRLLVYELDGVIYLADADGNDPARVGDGHLWATTRTGSVWSPDGRHFIYNSDGDRTTHISDAQGREVASFASSHPWGGPYWSPDSTRLQEWTDNGTQIAVYGIDGVLQASLALPQGYVELYDSEGVWAPDGQSVFVRIRQSDRREAWQLPIDGSAPHRLADDHPFARGHGAFSRDGRRVAYVIQTGIPGAPMGDLVVADADGSDARSIAQPGLSAFMAWSPDGERLADSGGDLVVFDVATGTMSTAVTGFSSDGYPPFSWSSASDKLLFAAPGDGGVTALWSVNVDGTDRTVLVEGATWGAMPPAGATDASLIRIAGHDVMVEMPAGVAWNMPSGGDAGNGFGWGGNDTEFGHVGSRWTKWYLYAPGDIDDPSRADDGMLPLPDDPVAWLRQLPGLTVLAERDIEVGGIPARMLDVVLPGDGGGTFMFEMPVDDSQDGRAFMDPGGIYSRYVIWQLGGTWMVAQATAGGLSSLETADPPGDPFMQFVADLRFP